MELQPLIDMDVINKIKDIEKQGAPGLVADLLDTFCTGSRELFVTMQQMIDEGNLDQISRSAHSLKGDSATIGALPLSEICLQIEVMVKAQSLNSIRLMLEQLGTMLDHTLAEIKKYLDNQE